MVICINVLNVNQALAEGLRLIAYHGRERPSRNGPVLAMPEPVATTYQDPTARVLFCDDRDANPFFHLMESIWMLAGENDVEWPAAFNKRMREYSDDGVIHGAYGYRWRTHFGVDQLTKIIDMLRAEPTTRRAALGMWDPTVDLGASKKDLPCNTMVYFDAQDGKTLDMTVTCRSNDMWWGAYGANAVHFSILHEVVATGAGLALGRYTQFSNNLHLYTDIVTPGLVGTARTQRLEDLSVRAAAQDRYTTELVGILRRRAKAEIGPVRQPVMTTTLTYFTSDCHLLMSPNALDHTYYNEFFNNVAKPMLAAWRAYKAKQYDEASRLVSTITAEDWRVACAQWLLRRSLARAHV